MSDAQATVQLSVPRLYPQQALIAESTKKRVLIKCGRRAGKTYLAAHKSLRRAGRGGKVLYGAPTAEQTDAFWEYLTEWIEPAIQAGYATKRLSPRVLTLPGGGTITAKTAYDIDTWRGGYGDLIIVDEYDYMKEDPLEKVILPMLVDNDGDLQLLSTPNRRRYLYRRYLEAKNNPDRWDIFELTSLENPHLSKEALAELTKEMTEDDYKQEILAQFVAGAGSVFTVKENTTWTPDVKKHKDCQKIMTIDWGQIGDFTSVSIGCVPHKKELALIRMKGRYPEQLARIKTIKKKWHIKGEIWAESNSMGLPLIQQLQDDGVSIHAFAMSSTTKPQVISGLKLAIENDEWQFVDDEAGNLELEAYESKQSERTGHISYNAPSGGHDDTVISRALMVYAVGQDVFAFF